MKRLQKTAVLAAVLLAGTGLATAAEARERERDGSHIADRVTRQAIPGHAAHNRYDVRHPRYRHRGHGYGHHRHHLGSRHGHNRHRGKHHYRHHRGYGPYRPYWHRYRHHGYRHHGFRHYRYGISFELDGVRYRIGGSGHR